MPPLQVSSFNAPPSIGCYFLDDPFDCIVDPALPGPSHLHEGNSVFSGCINPISCLLRLHASMVPEMLEPCWEEVALLGNNFKGHHCYQVTHNKPSQLSSHTKQGIMPIKLHIRRYHGYQFTYQRVFKQSLQILHLGYLARLYYHIWLKRCHWLSKQFRVFVYIKIC